MVSLGGAVGQGVQQSGLRVGTAGVLCEGDVGCPPSELGVGEHVLGPDRRECDDARLLDMTGVGQKDDLLRVHPELLGQRVDGAQVVVQPWHRADCNEYRVQLLAQAEPLVLKCGLDRTHVIL